MRNLARRSPTISHSRLRKPTPPSEPLPRAAAFGLTLYVAGERRAAIGLQQAASSAIRRPSDDRQPDGRGHVFRAASIAQVVDFLIALAEANLIQNRVRYSPFY